MKNILGAIFVGACLAALPACRSANPCFGVFLAIDYQLVYPINAATSVPDSPQAIVFTEIPGLEPIGPRLVLTPSSGPPVISGPPVPVPSPLPTPHGSPVPKLVAFSVPTLSAGTMYQVSFRGTQAGGCNFSLVGTGSFTTK